MILACVTINHALNEFHRKFPIKKHSEDSMEGFVLLGTQTWVNVIENGSSLEKVTKSKKGSMQTGKRKKTYEPDFYHSLHKKISDMNRRLK